MNTKITLIKQVCARVPTAYGEFQLCLYTNDFDKKEHLAFVRGDIFGKEDVLVRMHSECFTGDVLGSRRCDCGEQLDNAMKRIATEGHGLIIYLRQEGRGIGLESKLHAYNLQDMGLDTVDANLAQGLPAEGRDYGVAVEILRDLGIHSVRLMTNNPAKVEALESQGVVVSERIPSEATVYEDNREYLLTKAQRMNHQFNLDYLVTPGGIRMHIDS
jgi:3,4-dihydroxy 2-butanone 4-phosphate synthase/GTP cyclohydrolase II